jgi:hypothetical protein
MAYLVCLVIVLRVVLEDLRLLLVVEGANELVGAEFFPPLLTIDEPGKSNESTY